MIPSLPGILQAISLFAVAILIGRPLGLYIRDVMEGERVFLSPVIRPVERGVYKVMRIDETVEQRWPAYAVSVIVFSFVCILALYLQQRLQTYLPVNTTGASGVGNVAPDLAYNTSVSFDTNTNWQNYPGEPTMTYLTQMAGLAVRNFVSAATGIAVAHRPDSRTCPQVVAHDRQLLGRPDPQHALRPAADRHRQRALPRLAGRDPDLRRLTAGPHAPGRRPRPSRWVRSLRRKPSRSWAPTAVGSSTPTRPTRSRTRRRLSNWFEMLLVLIIPFAPDEHLRAHGRQRARRAGHFSRS